MYDLLRGIDDNQMHTFANCTNFLYGVARWTRMMHASMNYVRRRLANEYLDVRFHFFLVNDDAKLVRLFCMSE